MTEANAGRGGLKAAIAAIAILCAAAALAVLATASPVPDRRAQDAAAPAGTLEQKPLGR